jgi:putative glutamine amidotransferase
VRTIGICAAVERVRRGPWDEVVTMVQRTYPAAIQRAGALALLLPPDDAAGVPAQLLERIDALLLAGGADVDPGTYGAPRHPATGETWPERDRFEVAMARGALDRGMPVLGVCRGMQLLNVALGGTLVQHLPEVLGSEDHRRMPGVFGDHEVRLAPGSRAARAAGGEQGDDFVVTVKSHHHQGVAELGEGLVATAWSADDDLVEAIELPGDRYGLGVLWHPEEDGQSQVLASLVAATQAKVGAR